MEEGLQRIGEGPSVLHIMEGMLQGYLNKNPFFHQRLKIFDRQKPSYTNLIMTKNSPFKPLFKSISTSLRERGVTIWLQRKWEGKTVNTNYQVDKMVLSAGQVSPKCTTVKVALTRRRVMY